MLIAVIDLGTNTFNLAIAKLNTEISYLFSTCRAVFLGHNGIQHQIIEKDALHRALMVLQEFKNIINHYKVDHTIAIGTSALRTAKNAKQLTDEVKNKLDINIQIISGQEEALFIYRGICQSISYTKDPFLIVDIGGGSIELIIANSEEIFWEKSYPIGMARIISNIKFSDPIKTIEIQNLEKFFEHHIYDFFNVAKNFKLKNLIGAEGAFESFYSLARYNCNADTFKKSDHKHSHIMLIKHFKHIHDILIKTNLHERLALKGLEPYRASMIVPASIFVNLLLDKISPLQLIISAYSLKEGAIWSYFKNIK